MTILSSLRCSTINTPFVIWKLNNCLITWTLFEMKGFFIHITKSLYKTHHGLLSCNIKCNIEGYLQKDISEGLSIKKSSIFIFYALYFAFRLIQLFLIQINFNLLLLNDKVHIIKLFNFIFLSYATITPTQI